MARTKLAIDTEFSDFLRKYSKDLVLMRQNWLLNESQFFSFAGGLGLRAFGAVAREPGVLHRLGLLSADGRLGTDLLFHPFRIYTLHELLSGDPAVDAARAKVLNEVVDLAILLEPLYWRTSPATLRCRLAASSTKNDGPNIGRE